MDFAVQFSPGVSVDIVEATRDALSAIDGVQATQLSLPAKSAPALLVTLHGRVIDATHRHVTTQQYGVEPSGVYAPKYADAGAIRPHAAQVAGALHADVTCAEAVLLGISFLEAVQVRA